MDEIEYKLESKNPVLVAHAVSKLFEIIRKTVIDHGTNLTKVPEFKMLLSKKDSTDPNLNLCIAQALVALVEQRLWDIGDAMSTFISASSVKTNYVATATAIGQLIVLDLKNDSEKQSLNIFTLHTPQHPFIAILVQDRNSWHAILSQMKFIMNHYDPDIKEQSTEVLRPLFLYILCNPLTELPNDCKKETWQLLIKSQNTLDLQLEVLLWSCTNHINTCASTNDRILELGEIALIEKNRKRCITLLPILASLLVQILKYASDPRSNLDMMLRLLELGNDSAGTITLLLMAEAITICPAVYLYDILQICVMITRKMNCSHLSLNVLISSILNWMAYPSILCSNALDLAKKLIHKIGTASRSLSTKENSLTLENDFFMVFSLSDSNIQFYLEIIERLNTWTDDEMLLWLNEISLVSINLRQKSKLLFSGLLLQSDNPEITRLTCNILVDIAREIKSLGSFVLSLVLHKLTRTECTLESKYLLLALPELVTTKENVPIITHTLDTLLNADKPLKYFAIELYLKALDKEPRTYRFLSNAIVRTMKNDRSWYADATCARAMRYICENHSQHGENFVPLLSEILSRCVDINGGTASALALKSISALCRSTVIGICSTWQALAPKMQKETRTIVLESLCEFLGDVPNYPSKMDEEYDKLMLNVVTSLWKYATGDDVRVAKAALKALTNYDLEQIPLKTLPHQFRCDLALPAAYTRLPTEAGKSPEDVLPYIPSTCWVQLLQKINRAVLPSVGDLLISFIKREINGFRSGIYIWQEEPHNFKYLPDKSVIRAVGEYLRKSDKSKPDNYYLVLECLRMFAHKYPKPLPNVNWSFLEDTSRMSKEAKEYTLLIACHTTPISQSARLFIESYLWKHKTPEDFEVILENKEYLVIYNGLEDIVQTIQPNYLKLFLETTLENVLEKMKIDDQDAIKSFNVIMTSYGKALKNQEIHDGNSTLLSSTLEKLLDRIDLTKDCYEPCIEATLQVSTKHLERMTSPRVWWEITTEKLKNAIAIRARLELKRRTDTPLSWLNECIDVAATVPGAQMYLLETMRKVQLEMQFDRASSTWVLNFLSEIRGLIADAPEGANDKVTFYCNVLFISIICLSGIDCILTDKDVAITSNEVRMKLFVYAIATLADRQDWKSAISQIMEWLNYMKTSSMSDAYKSTFFSALVCLKHTPYYKDVWTKYLSIKTIIKPNITSHV